MIRRPETAWGKFPVCADDACALLASTKFWSLRSYGFGLSKQVIAEIVRRVRCLLQAEKQKHMTTFNT